MRLPLRTTISAGVQQFVGSFGLNVCGGGAVSAAFVIATVPMFVLVGVTMRTVTIIPGTAIPDGSRC
jgi:hypothetical protein